MAVSRTAVLSAKTHIGTIRYLPSMSKKITERPKSAQPTPGATMESTVLLATANKDLLTLVRQINLPGLQLWEVRHKTDLVAVPCCLAYVDATWLDADLVGMLSGLAQDGDAGFRLVVLGSLPDMPERLRAITSKAPHVWSRKILMAQITTAIKMAKGEMKRQRQFHNRVYRIIRLYHHLHAGKRVVIDQVLGRFGVTERTLRRDLKVLRDLFPDLPIMYDRKFKE